MATQDLILAKRNLHGVNMTNLHHICDNCGSEFTIKYDEDQTETDPLHCPFCAEYITEHEEVDDDE